MKPQFYSLGNRLKLMVIQNENTHEKNTTILIDTYNIYKDLAMSDLRQGISKSNNSHLERIKDPDYLGYLTVQKSTATFAYTGDGITDLSHDELEQLIEQIKA
jgi:hypothetical protein